MPQTTVVEVLVIAMAITLLRNLPYLWSQFARNEAEYGGGRLCQLWRWSKQNVREMLETGAFLLGLVYLPR